MIKESLKWLIILAVYFFNFGSEAADCEIFPKSNIWNTKIANAPVHKQSATWLNSIEKGVKVHPDFGSKTFMNHAAGIPVNYTDKNTKKHNVLFKYKAESDLVKYPIPEHVKIEGGSSSKGDRHIISFDTDQCILYEIFNAYRRDSGQWTAGSGAMFDLNSNNLRPDKWTSADAAGLPIFPGLVRYQKLVSGTINHALRFTLPKTSKNYIWPARHYASKLNDTSLPPMGMRLRLKASFNISNLSPQAKIIAKTLQEYGMILADNGGALFITGEPNENWDNNDLRDLKQLTTDSFEVVDVAQWQLTQDSAEIKSIRPNIIN